MEASQPVPPEAIVCQYSGESCSTASTHYRKVISHIFGRNKRCTVGIPDYIWIYYCRKHYQRARYRTAEWPFRQCELAIDTIENMRSWGGVASFNLQLRRRETQRTSGQNTGGDDDVADNGDNNNNGQSEMREPSQPPRAGAFTPINTAPSANSPSPSPMKTEEEDSDDDKDEENKTGPAARQTKKKRSPTIVPHPVPDWLHGRVGNNKSFDEILSVLVDLRTHLNGVAARNQTPHFPDIEILPNLRPRAAAPRRPTRRATSSTPTTQAPSGNNAPRSNSPTATSIAPGPSPNRPPRRAARPSVNPPAGPSDVPPPQSTRRGPTRPSIIPPYGPGDSTPSIRPRRSTGTEIGYMTANPPQSPPGGTGPSPNPALRRRSSRISEHGAIKKPEKK
ncbi:hypothetical protein FQN52_008540 [Onygenales sp. PD_12]|nr:hypothetical protein FQN52_008540 [Onygenales sp. PD_12]